MTFEEAMKELKKHGTAQNRKVYARHGAQEPMFGVSYANFKAMAKRIKTDHALAKRLWASGNHDARILATMIADPDQLDGQTLDSWVKDVNCYPLGDALSGLAGKTKHGRAKAEKWSKSKNDFIGQVGWNLTGGMAFYGTDPDPGYFREKIATIESQIHKAHNRTRHAMNMALCGIGIGIDALRDEAIDAARRIGNVKVDHGETGCKTPDAADYIKKAAMRRKKLRNETPRVR